MNVVTGNDGNEYLEWTGSIVFPDQVMTFGSESPVRMITPEALGVESPWPEPITVKLWLPGDDEPDNPAPTGRFQNLDWEEPGASDMTDG